MLLRRHKVAYTQPVVSNEPAVKVAEPIEKEIETKEKETTSYSRTEINRMNKSELIDLATSEGLDAEDKSGTELKEMLLTHFDL